jgi:energy-coupling factor transport system ATP-binding protein
MSTRKKTVAEISKNVGLVFQNSSYQIFEGSIFDELAFAPKNAGFCADDIKERVKKTSGSLSLNLSRLSDSPFLLPAVKSKGSPLAVFLH